MAKKLKIIKLGVALAIAAVCLALLEQLPFFVRMNNILRDCVCALLAFPILLATDSLIKGKRKHPAEISSHREKVQPLPIVREPEKQPPPEQQKPEPSNAFTFTKLLSGQNKKK